MRIDVTREVSFRASTSDGGDGDGLTLDGYAAGFGQATRIDSWEGMFDETFARGSFRKTLRERSPLMQYDHGRHPLIGSIPIGRYDSLTEDEQGLHVVGRLTDNWLIQPVRDAIADGGVTGMSIRFEVVKDEWRDAKGKVVKAEELMDLLWQPGDRGPLQRTVKEAKLLEAGPVAWPAYPQTSVGVRAQAEAAAILSDDDRMRALRQSLMQSAAAPAVPDVDPHDLALALLRSGETPEPEKPEDPAPAPVSPPEDIAAEDGDSEAPQITQDSAPPAVEAPADEGRSTTSPVSDAPPASGHPSQSDHARRPQVARQLRVALSGARKK
jgi:HK97 family phage prohead protease